MKVEAILQDKGRRVETIRPDTTLLIAVHKLTTDNIGALVVSTDGVRVEGVLSERDVVRALARSQGDPLALRVSAVMSRGVPVCSRDDTLVTVMGVMTRTRNRHLPVVDDNGLCGIVSLGDVVKNRLEEVELETHVLRDAYLTRS